MKKQRVMIGLCFGVLVFMMGCQKKEEVVSDVKEEVTEAPQVQEATDKPYAVYDLEEEWIFVDRIGNEYILLVDAQANLIQYDTWGFYYENGRPHYDGEGYRARLGVDVSYYQDDIEWERVKKDGMEFAIVRIGYRGYGAAGTLNADTAFEKHMKGARDAGLDVGVYFFAQAINEQEAIEEAEYVLELLKGRELDLPVVYDPETVLEPGARTAGVSREQFTKNAKAFCDTIEDAGYDSMIYCNMLWQAFELDMSELKDYKIWYADYEPYPQTPYHFDMWQYTYQGSVDGISGNVDINMQMIKEK